MKTDKDLLRLIGAGSDTPPHVACRCFAADLRRVYDAGKEEAEELRQQLGAMEDKYLVEKGMRRLASAEAESLRQQLAEAQADRDAIKKEWEKAYEIGVLAKQQLAACERQRDKLKFALENCRLFAARNRKESWALLILGFLAECGVVGSPLRDSSDHCEPDWTEYDGEYLK